jgi:hypothetical protein
MNDLQAPARFLVWVLGIALTIGAFGSLGKMSMNMMASAIEAQKHDQISWGRYSRQLWSRSQSNNHSSNR